MLCTTFTFTVCSVDSPEGRVPTTVKVKSRGCSLDVTVMVGRRGLEISS